MLQSTWQPSEEVCSAVLGRKHSFFAHGDLIAVGAVVFHRVPLIMVGSTELMEM